MYLTKNKNRLGDCKWLPKDGDIVLCVKHSGDCFNDYRVLRKQDHATWKLVEEFSAYAFGTIMMTVIDCKYHLLMAGEPVTLPLTITDCQYHLFNGG